MTAAVLRGDAVRLPLRDESVDLIVTSPPYFALRSYQDDGGHYDGQIGSEATPQAFLEALWAVTAECVRVLKPCGSMFVNLGDKYAGGGQGGHTGAALDQSDAYRKGRAAGYGRPKNVGVRGKSLMGLPWRYAIGCIDRLGLILRAELVWSKPNGLPESVTDRVRRSHEQWFHLTREGRYFSAVDEIREGSAPASTTARRGPTFGLKTNTDRGDVGAGNFLPNPLGKLPGSVWTIASEPLRVPAWLGVDHFAAFPQEWPRRLILGWSPTGVCTACGEGRRPVVDTERVPLNGSFGKHGTEVHGPDGRRGMRAEQNATITGYACACWSGGSSTGTAGSEHGSATRRQTPPPTRPAVVLDPFAGTGTTPMVARALGRVGIGVDLSSDYCRLARWRVFDSRHSAKSVARTHREAQGGLFGAVS